MSFTYHNPVKICFGVDYLKEIECIAKDYKDVLLLTTNGFKKRGIFKDLKARNIHIFSEITPNPQLENLQYLKQNLPSFEAIIALGGGSVIDSAKFFALESEISAQNGALNFTNALAKPIFAFPTTAGTGSELTKWATIWDKQNNIKYSLQHSNLYPRKAFYDINLMLDLPLDLTLYTALDALSHAIESVWNKGANPISTHFALKAIDIITRDLPLLRKILTKEQERGAENADDKNAQYSKNRANANADSAESAKSAKKLTQRTNHLYTIRESICKASIFAALAFSNTQTALAHAISYPLSMRFNVPHGLACSFSLPLLLENLPDSNAKNILKPFKPRIIELFNTLEIPTNPRNYGIDSIFLEAILATLNDRAKNSIFDIKRVKRAFLNTLDA